MHLCPKSERVGMIYTAASENDQPDACEYFCTHCRQYQMAFYSPCRESVLDFGASVPSKLNTHDYLCI